MWLAKKGNSGMSWKNISGLHRRAVGFVKACEMLELEETVAREVGAG